MTTKPRTRRQIEKGFETLRKAAWGNVNVLHDQFEKMRVLVQQDGDVLHRAEFRLLEAVSGAAQGTVSAVLDDLRQVALGDRLDRPIAVLDIARPSAATTPTRASSSRCRCAAPRPR